MSQRNRRSRKSKMPFFGLLLLGAGVVLLLRNGFSTQAESQVTPLPATPLPVTQVSLTAEATPKFAFQTPPANALSPFLSLMPIDAAQIDDTGLLVLVNNEHPTPSDSAPDKLACAYRVVPVRIADMYLHTTALTALDALFDAAVAAGFDNLVFSSGYRDAAEQKQIYDDAVDKRFVQPPGYSEHQTGLAADVFALGVTEAAMPRSAEGQWLAANAVRFGFILRYPEGKEDITGIAYEPWHFRYIGAPHAAFCTEQGLTYEEYITWLQEGGGYQMEAEGKTYTVLYEPADSGIINVPGPNIPFSISGDNAGGYIITAWE